MLGPRGTGGNNKILKSIKKDTKTKYVARLQIFESENSVEISTKQSFITAASQLEAK